MVRCAEKMCVRRGVSLHSTSLTRQSLLPVSETYVKKCLSLAHVAPLRPVQNLCSDASVSSLHMTTAHPLCHHHRCFCVRLSCHSSLLHPLCDHVDAEADDSSEKSFFSNFDLATPVFPGSPGLRTQEHLHRLLKIFSLLHGTRLKILGLHFLKLFDSNSEFSGASARCRKCLPCQCSPSTCRRSHPNRLPVANFCKPRHYTIGPMTPLLASLAFQ